MENSLEAEFFDKKGYNKSDLSTFVASDLSLTHSHIFCNPHLKDLINSMTGGTTDMMGNNLFQLLGYRVVYVLTGPFELILQLIHRWGL